MSAEQKDDCIEKDYLYKGRIKEKFEGRFLGYVTDHIQPLACNENYGPKNMQWQTVENAQAQNRWVRIRR